MKAQAMAMPRTDPAAAADGFAALERLWYELEPPEGVRVELIDGELVVSPTGSVRHSTAIDKLTDQLVDLKRRRGWIFQDREQKPRAYAQGGVPLYVLIDRFDKPSAVTLFSQPGEDGYGKRQVAAAGEPLRLARPFGIALDIARLLS